MPDERRPVLSVEEALARILTTVDVPEPERVGLLEAAGRVLAEEVTADRDIPPLTNSAMDGYAVRGVDISPTQASARLRVVGEVAAGHVSPVRVEPGTAVRIMTGAPVPAGADTVVRFEDIRRDGDWIEVLEAPPTGANVRAAGEDVRAGQIMLRPGKVLRPQEIGMLAAVGRVAVAVVRRPRVAILATGDEVVPPDQLPGPGQIQQRGLRVDVEPDRVKRLLAEVVLRIELEDRAVLHGKGSVVEKFRGRLGHVAAKGIVDTAVLSETPEGHHLRPVIRPG